jgi:hypothetical protein
MIRYIRWDVAINTETVLSADEALSEMDRRSEAFHFMLEAEGPEAAVRSDFHVAEYMAYARKGLGGEEAKALRDIIESDAFAEKRDQEQLVKQEVRVARIRTPRPVKVEVEDAPAKPKRTRKAKAVEIGTPAEGDWSTPVAVSA